jgi:mannose-6-phosphate isomerase-like protein (cupin superfamily)
MNPIFDKIEKELQSKGFHIVSRDTQRPWGGFFVLDENQAQQFVQEYFPGFSSKDLIAGRKVSPKILAVAPNKRLSWQYHHRRSEVWRVLEGPVGIVRSNTDEEGLLRQYQNGELVTLSRGERHRLVGLDSWGIVAEIWQHMDPANPSNEDDIVRLQDDFGR